MTKADRTRERQICEAIVRTIESIENACRSGGCSPEDMPERYLDDMRIDWLAHIGARNYALEVTQLQPMPERIKNTTELAKFSRSIMDQLEAELPSDYTFKIVVAQDHFSELSGEILKNITPCVIKWISFAAMKQDTQSSIRLTADKSDGIAFEAKLYRFAAPSSKCKLRFLFELPDDSEIRQSREVGRALDKKIPKLQKWQQSGADAVLILETRDIALSDELCVASLVRDELVQRCITLTYVFIVDTSCTPWIVYLCN